jgi:hypothetical protein
MWLAKRVRILVKHNRMDASTAYIEQRQYSNPAGAAPRERHRWLLWTQLMGTEDAASDTLLCCCRVS